MSDLKVEILLPLYYNSDTRGKRSRVEGAKYAQTYSEIIGRFGGCTVDNSTLLGGWINPDTGKKIRDENVTYWVVCRDTRSNIRFLFNLKKRLKERFLQDEIMMYYIQIHRI
ncbi:MAG: hypothetical protein ACREAY_00835 [Nitrososphaera sp.]|uniref:hypothetical protein n=1 Tax=Nitrososphaera sp. TaxID=1971748 RepID=UPI003D6F4B79